MYWFIPQMATRAKAGPDGKSEAWNSIWVSDVGGRIGHPCAVFPGPSAGSWVGSREARIPTSTLICEVGITSGSLAYCTKHLLLI